MLRNGNLPVHENIVSLTGIAAVHEGEAPRELPRSPFGNGPDFTRL